MRKLNLQWFCTQNHILEPFSVRRACTQCYVTSELYPRPSQILCQNVRETRKKIVIKCRGESFARCRVIARYVKGGLSWPPPPSLIRVNLHSSHVWLSFWWMQDPHTSQMCHTTLYGLNVKFAHFSLLCLWPVRVPEALCFWVVRPSVHTGISLPRNLKNPWVDFYQTWYRGAPWQVDELIRFWARSAQGQRSMNLVKKCYFYLVTAKSQESLGGFSSNLAQGCTMTSRWTIRFWARSAQGQR